MSNSRYDFARDTVVIGAGVVGLAVARELQMAGQAVMLIEAQASFGMETSSHNSEVIHAGIYYEIKPTIITGWNIDFFDIPYLYNRMCKILGENIARTLSPIKDVIWLKHRNRYRISGVSCLDYLALYKNFTYSEESSYSLEAISQKELGRGKLKYAGGIRSANADMVS